MTPKQIAEYLRCDRCEKLKAERDAAVAEVERLKVELAEDDIGIEAMKDSISDLREEAKALRDKFELLHKRFDDHRRESLVCCDEHCFCWEVEVWAAQDDAALARSGDAEKGGKG